MVLLGDDGDRGGVAAPIGERERLDPAVRAGDDLPRGRGTRFDLGDDPDSGLAQRCHETGSVAGGS